MCSGPSSPDYQHSPSHSHCSSNHNNSLTQQTSMGNNIVYDKVSTSGTNHTDNSNGVRTLLVASKPNLRSFTVPVAPPIIPPPTIPSKQQVAVTSSTAQCK